MYYKCILLFLTLDILYGKAFPFIAYKDIRAFALVLLTENRQFKVHENR